MVVLCAVALAGCSTIDECGPFGDECRRAVEELENAGGDVVAVRDTPCPRAGALRCFVLTTVEGDELSAEAYPDRVDIGRYQISD